MIIAVVLLGFAIRGLMRGFSAGAIIAGRLIFGSMDRSLKFVPLGEWVQHKFPLTEPLPFHIAFLAIFLSVASLASMVAICCIEWPRGC